MTQDKARTQAKSLSVSSTGFALWLSELDNAVDWQAFDRYFLWLQRPDTVFRHTPLQLFKSLLLRNWFSLSALEFNHEMSDRKSFREFTAIPATNDVPRHHEIVSFQALLVSRSIATDVAQEFDRQISSLALELPQEVALGLNCLDSNRFSNATPDTLWSEDSGPDWAHMEQRLFNFWRNNNLASDRIKLSDLSDLSDHLTLIRVLPGEGFRYELVGAAVEEANEGSLLGATISDKLRANIDLHGEPGLQVELSTLFSRVVDTRQASSLATYFLNAKFNKCHLLTAQVPVRSAGDVDGIDFLLGISLIRKLAIS